ncbi:outer membrane protein [Bradyrhizobium sp.]|uniref:outer membrane protein n=1 Tax=Bradyrhizobium sp. TaxID=376 RepID=UPI002735EF8A|nr:outer membrane beta-barrel protein [Bradyrhizobium sp.]MDP3692404.1 outer membrane beta-barrel protein [Bradyrhizobium sp.]
MQSKFIALLSGAALSLGLVTAASAADMAARPYTKAPAPMIAAMYNWSGFYVGINGGGGWSRKCWDATSVLGIAVVPSVAEGCHDASGGTVGGQVGYRWQAAAWVFGLEAQGNWADFNGSNASLFLPGASNRSKIDAFGLFTGQVGYAFNNMLLYVKGGAAVTNDKYDGFVTATNVVFDTGSETRWGASVGVGGEFGITPNLSLAIEYNHLFMGDRDIAFTAVAVPLASRTDRISQDVDIVTARLNYRFGGPVVAKY